MQDTTMTIRFESPLREKVEAMAEAERRTVEEQTAYLLEKGLSVIEQQGGQAWITVLV
jgi:predicted transcriptional regulator